MNTNLKMEEESQIKPKKMFAVTILNFYWTDMTN